MGELDGGDRNTPDNSPPAGDRTAGPVDRSEASGGEAEIDRGPDTGLEHEPGVPSDYDDGAPFYETGPGPTGPSDYDDGDLPAAGPVDTTEADGIGDGSTGAAPEADQQLADARADVEAAYDTSSGTPSPSTPQEFHAQAAAWAGSVVDAPGPSDAPLGDGDGLGGAGDVAAAKQELQNREAAGDTLGGSPVERADLWHQQGDNDLGYQQDCALASTSAVLQDCGVQATEDDVVQQAVAEGRCMTDFEDPADNGGVAQCQDLSEIMASRGVDSDVQHLSSADELADVVEDGRGVIAPVNSGELWDGKVPVGPQNFGTDGLGRPVADHAVVVTGTVRDESGQLTGFVINDTGHPWGAANQVDLATWDRCWTGNNREGEAVITARSTDEERSSQQ